MAAKKGLGKGLDSLIPSKPIESAKEVSDQNAVENAKAMVSIDKIEPNAEQPRKAFDEDALMETALEAGAEDMITHDDSYEIQTAPENYTAVHGALTDAGYEMVDSDVEFVPSMESAPKDAHDLKQLKKMIDILEDNDDVQKVHHNCSVDLEEVE